MVLLDEIKELQECNDVCTNFQAEHQRKCGENIGAIDKLTKRVEALEGKDKHHYMTTNPTGKIDKTDFSNAFEDGRCVSFKNFCDEALNYGN